MDMLNGMALGFSIATTMENLGWAAVGAIIGTFVGIMPGLGTTATIAILMPLTFGMNPTSSLILMTSIFCGSKYGGAITSILMNLPGEASSVPTTLDGYPLALQGRAGPALGLAAISGFIAGTISVIGLMLLGPALSIVAINFAPPEYFAMTFAGLCLVSALAGNSIAKAAIMVFLGLTISVIGNDLMSGVTRLTFGRIEFLDGIDFVVVAVGLFAISEILLNIEKGIKLTLIKVPNRLSQLLPTRQEVIQCIPTWIRSTFIGFIVGILPGTGSSIASFLSYGITKSVSKTPERFGKGAVEGVAAAESADNASTGGSMVPMLTLGVPGSAATAMMMGALILVGITPGPLLIQNHPDTFWGVVASMYVSNIMLIIINLPLIPVIVQFVRIPYYALSILIICVTSIGIYAVDYSLLDVQLMILFGVMGYIFRKLDYPLAPLVLALVLGPLIERALRQTMIMSRGSMEILFVRPICFTLIALGLLALMLPLLRRAWVNRSRFFPASR